MELIAAVRPVDNIPDYVFRPDGIALRQQVRTFMLIPEKLAAGCIALWEDEVTYNSEARVPVGADESVSLRPSVETDGEAVFFQHTVHLGKTRFKPGGIVVIG